jgi:hypothetical protein
LVRFAAVITALLAALVLAATASAFRLGGPLSDEPSNPADAMTSQPIENEVYDEATHCSAADRPGMDRFVAWMAKHSRRGVSWGTYRCERWGKHSASLHAENRALDWHLDVTDAGDRAEARRLIDLLLAPDVAGNDHALARRMGIEEIIWDCSYWGAGSDDFGPYAPCFDKKGKPVRHMDPTVGHRNHIHFGMTRAGSMARTSFWQGAGKVSRAPSAAGGVRAP